MVLKKEHKMLRINKKDYTTLKNLSNGLNIKIVDIINLLLSYSDNENENLKEINKIIEKNQNRDLSFNFEVVKEQLSRIKTSADLAKFQNYINQSDFKKEIMKKINENNLRFI